jgi:hypothetical protein
VDASDKVHISYYYYTDAALKYATNITGTWTTETVDKNGVEGRDNSSTSIVVDSKNRVHISYYDYTNSDLKYATASLLSMVYGNVVDKHGKPFRM